MTIAVLSGLTFLVVISCLSVVIVLLDLKFSQLISFIFLIFMLVLLFKPDLALNCKFLILFSAFKFVVYFAYFSLKLISSLGNVMVYLLYFLLILSFNWQKFIIFSLSSVSIFCSYLFSFLQVMNF